MLPSQATSARQLDGKRTELLVQVFADRIIVLVTQMGKVGNLIQASIPPTTPLPSTLTPHPSQPNALPLPLPPAAIQLTPLLGNAPSEYMQTLHSLYAAQIATIIWCAVSEGLGISRRNVVVGVALRNSEDGPGTGLSAKDRVVFREVMAMLQELLQSAVERP